jgi:hypothetical protein
MFFFVFLKIFFFEMYQRTKIIGGSLIVFIRRKIKNKFDFLLTRTVSSITDVPVGLQVGIRGKC